MSSTFPTTLNEGDYHDYAQYLLKLEIGFIVVGVVLSIILLILYIKFGVSKAEPTAFTSRTKCTLTGVFLLFLIANAVACAVGWSYNAQCSQGVNSGFASVQTAIYTSQLRVLNMNDTITSLVDGLDGDVAQGEGIVNGLSAILEPLRNIFSVAGLIQQEIRSITQDLNLTVGCFNRILVDLANVREEQERGHISGVPDTSQVPNISQSYFQQLDTAFDEVNQTSSIADSVTSQLNTSIVNLGQLTLSELPAITSTYTEKANQVTALLTSGSGHITNGTIEFQDFRSEATHYSTIRTQVVSAILVAPIVISIVALAGLFLKMKFLLQLAYIVIFIIMFWYWAIAGMNFLAYTAVGGFCASQNQLLITWSSSLHQNFTIPGQNVTIDLGARLPQILECSGNTTFVDIFQVSFLVDELNGQISAEVAKLGNFQSQFNQTEPLQDGINTVQGFLNSTNINFTQGQNISNLISALDGVSAQLNNLTNFGFPTQQYDQSLEEVNAITNNLALLNGTTVHLYYNSSNILLLNTNDDPYTKANPQTRNELTGKAETAQNLTRYRNEILTEISYIQSNISDTQQQLTFAQGYINAIQNSTNQIAMYGGDIIADLEQMFNFTQTTINQINALTADFQREISSALATFVQDTSCAFIGAAYAGVTTSVCTTIVPTFRAVTAALVVNAILFFVLGILSAWTVSLIKRDLLCSS